MSLFVRLIRRAGRFHPGQQIGLARAAHVGAIIAVLGPIVFVFRSGLADLWRTCGFVIHSLAPLAGPVVRGDLSPLMPQTQMSRKSE